MLIIISVNYLFTYTKINKKQRHFYDRIYMSLASSVKLNYVIKF